MGVQSESIVGEFKDGRFLKGILFDERALVIGSFRQDDDDGLVLDGWQPEVQSKDDIYCAICFEACAIFTMKRCFKECGHGTCCAACSEAILGKGRKCPMCRREVTEIVTFL